MARKILPALVLLWSMALGAIQTAESAPLILGSVNSDPTEELKDWLPFVRHLATELARDGVSEGRVVVTRDTQQMAALLKAAKVDLYIDSPLTMLDVINASGAKLMARRWKKGVAEYTSVIFARKDSGITSPADLKNRILAFQNGVSSSGYLLPWLELQRAGFRSVLMSSPTMTPPEGRIGYVYSGADRNTIAWVLYGRVAAGATTRNDFEKLSEEQHAQLAVIHETIAIPRHIVVYRGDLAPKLAARVTDILTTMHETESGRKALAAFEGTEKFDEIPRESVQLLKTLDDDLQKARLSQ